MPENLAAAVAFVGSAELFVSTTGQTRSLGIPYGPCRPTVRLPAGKLAVAGVTPAAASSTHSRKVRAMSSCGTAVQPAKPALRCQCCGTPLPDDVIVPAHSPDFREVVWPINGEAVRFRFSPLQASFIRVLWEAWEEGSFPVGINHLIDAIGTERNNPSVTSIFRAGVQTHPAMHVLIVNVGRGLWKLADFDPPA
jgi:hypothetical protein